MNSHQKTTLLGLILVFGSVQPIAAQSDYATAYFFSTLAGASSVGSVDGMGAQARFTSPGAIARDSSGNIYVADTGNHLIRRIAPDGRVTTVAGRAGQPGSADGRGDSARFNSPSGIAIEASGNLVVADTSNHILRRVKPDGEVTTIAGLAEIPGFIDGTAAQARFAYPRSVVIDGIGTIIVADTGNSSIRRISPSGVVSTLAGRGGQPEPIDGPLGIGRFGSIGGIAITPASGLIVTDPLFHIIRRVASDGTITTLAGTPSRSPPADPQKDGSLGSATFHTPVGVATDAVGNVYITDYGFSTVRRIDPSGNVSTMAGVPGALGDNDGTGADARFHDLGGITAGGSGDLYVIDGNTVRHIGGEGRVRTVAGLSTFGSADGASERLFAPSGVAVDSDGTIYVADYGNHVIRKVTASGQISTLAGRIGEEGAIDGPANEARFKNPSDVAVDGAGNVYVSDSRNLTLRRISPSGMVTTVAGLAGNFGLRDGRGADARFSYMNGLTVDRAGNIFVADGKAVRRVTPQGEVTSLPDLSGAAFSHTFYNDVAIGGDDRIYVSDPTYERILIVQGTNMQSVRTEGFLPLRLGIARDGRLFFTGGSRKPVVAILHANQTVEVIGGHRTQHGVFNGNGSAARFMSPSGLAVDSNANLYITDSDIQTNLLRKGQPGSEPVITPPPSTGGGGGNPPAGGTSAGGGGGAASIWGLALLALVVALRFSAGRRR